MATLVTLALHCHYRSDVQSLEEELEEKRQQVKSFAGETVLRGDDFKRYVNSLREGERSVNSDLNAVNRCL